MQVAKVIDRSIDSLVGSFLEYFNLQGSYQCPKACNYDVILWGCICLQSGKIYNMVCRSIYPSGACQKWVSLHNNPAGQGDSSVSNPSVWYKHWESLYLRCTLIYLTKCFSLNRCHKSESRFASELEPQYKAMTPLWKILFFICCHTWGKANMPRISESRDKLASISAYCARNQPRIVSFPSYFSSGNHDRGSRRSRGR